MGYDLVGKGGYFDWRQYHWKPLLVLAVQYGWEPEYPLGEYVGNDWQVLSDKDAISLGAAIERAATAAEGEDLAGFEVTAEVLPALRDKLLKFGVFCSKGGFDIG